MRTWRDPLPSQTSSNGQAKPKKDSQEIWLSTFWTGEGQMVDYSVIQKPKVRFAAAQRPLPSPSSMMNEIDANNPNRKTPAMTANRSTRMNEVRLGITTSHRPLQMLWTYVFAAALSLGIFAAWAAVDSSEAQAQSLPSCNSSYYNYRRCSGNYRYRCTRRSEVYYYYVSCGWYGWSSCRRTGYRYSYYWTLDSSSSSYYYCQYGCYNSGSQAYCRCSGGYSSGQQYCSGNYMYQCNATTYRYGSASNRGYCQYGCYRSSNRAYCRCSGSRTGNQQYCSGNYRYRCNYTTSRYGSVSNLGYCQYGCYNYGSTAYCKCTGNRTYNSQYCSGNYRYRCNLSTSRYGSQTNMGYCYYGCFMNGSTAYCKCSGGRTYNQQYCSGNYRYRCNLSTSYYGSASNIGYCQYGCYMNGSTAYCRCSNGYTGNEEYCSGNYRYRCNYTTSRYGSTSLVSSSSSYYYCQYGCYQYNGRRTYCRCSGGRTYNQTYCSGSYKYRCNLTTYRYGSTTNIGTCNCVHGGVTRNVGTYWCSGNYRYYCNSGTVQNQGYCQYGCYQSGSNAYCKCSNGRTGNQQWCSGNYRYRCNYTTSRYGSTSNLGYCQYGCYMYGSSAYCKCSGNRTYNQQYCSGNYRYRCNLTTSRYGSASSLGYCQYGCYASGSSTYCRCSNGYTGNEEWCSGNYRYKCNYTTSRYGSTGLASSSSTYYYCQYGCYQYNGRKAYCRCTGGQTYNQTYCSGNNKYRCNLTNYRYGSGTYIGSCACTHNGVTRAVGTYWCYSNYRYYCNSGTVQQQNRCTYGCYQSGSNAYCKCPGGRTSTGYYCYSNYKYYCRGGDTSSDGNVSNYGSCPYGCQQSGSNVYCRCRSRNGTTLNHGQIFCSNYSSTSSYNNSRYANYYSDRNGGTYRLQCNNGNIYRYGSTSSSSSNGYYCQYGCYVSGSNAYCKCSGYKKGGEYYCSGTNRYRCNTTAYRYGNYSSTPCSSGYICTGNGTCVLNKCTYKGQTYNNNQYFCDGSRRMRCYNRVVSAQNTCSYGCYTSGNNAYCRCPGGRTSTGYYCFSNYKYYCRGGDTSSDGNVSNYGYCQYGCMMSGSTAYCRCRTRNGTTLNHNQIFCSNYSSTSTSNNSRYANYYSDRNGGTYRLRCSNGAIYRYGSTSSSSSNGYYCQYGCYVSGSNAFCKCTGYKKGGEYYCSGTNRYRCNSTAYRYGNASSTPCSSGYICTGSGTCVLNRCTYKGRTYTNGTYFCDGNRRMYCRNAVVSAQNTCTYGCYTSGSSALCRCPGGRTSTGYYCYSNSKYYCRGGDTSSDGNVSNYGYCQYGCMMSGSTAYCRCRSANGSLLNHGQIFCTNYWSSSTSNMNRYANYYSDSGTTGRYRAQCNNGNVYRYGSTSSSSSNGYYCQYGCYVSGTNAYCKCSGGTKGGSYFCSGTNRYRCNTSAYRYGNYSSTPCSSGYICKGTGTCVLNRCTYNGKTYQNGTYFCNGNQRMYCSNTVVTAQNTCSYGCYTSGSSALCRCPGARTTTGYYCYNNYRYYCRGGDTTSDGNVTNYGRCTYGCQQVGSNVYCKCRTRNGTTLNHGQVFCSNYSSTSYVNNNRYSNYYSDSNSYRYRLQCNNGNLRRYGSTSSSSSNGYYCQYGCYVSGNNAYCKCVGNTKGGSYYCSGTNRYRCNTSAYRYGNATSTPCSSGYICKGTGTCVVNQCTHKGKNYKNGAYFCDGNRRMHCNNTVVTAQNTCSYGCYTSGSSALCKCPGGRTSVGYYCYSNTKYYCRGGDTSSDGNVSNYGRCSYGCQQVGSNVYCKCASGGTIVNHGQHFCSSSSSGSTYYTDRNSASYRYYCNNGSLTRASGSSSTGTSNSYYCDYGCYVSGFSTYCKCPGAIKGGSYYCSGLERRLCQTSQYRRGRYTRTTCNSGYICKGNGTCVLNQCTYGGKTYKNGTYFCNGNQRMYCNNTVVTAQNTCSYGCYTSGSSALCKCPGGKTSTGYYCLNNYKYYCRGGDTTSDGNVSNYGRCSYGCMMVGSTAYCKCRTANGSVLNHGQIFCSNYSSTSTSNNNRNARYSSDSNSYRYRLQCNNGNLYRYGSTSSSSSNSYYCTYGCYVSGSNAYCKCPGNNKGGSYYCSGTSRYLCQTSARRNGDAVQKNCSTGYICKNSTCVLNQCTHGGKTYKHGTYFCNGNQRLLCSNTVVTAQNTCSYGCYTSGTNAFCKCPGGRTSTGYYCFNNTKYYCRGGDNTSDGNVSNYGYCQYGCQQAGSNVYCKCRTRNGTVLNHGQQYCASSTSTSSSYYYADRSGGSYRMYCNNGSVRQVSTSSSTSTSNSYYCRYGCYISGTNAYCKCSGNIKGGSYYCSGTNRYLCQNSGRRNGQATQQNCATGLICTGSGTCTTSDCNYKGKKYKSGTYFCDGNRRIYCLNAVASAQNTCSYGCYTSGTSALCKCPGGRTTTGNYCYSNTKYYCRGGDTSSDGNVTNNGRCTYGCQQVGSNVYCKCSVSGRTINHGDHYCSSNSSGSTFYSDRNGTSYRFYCNNGSRTRVSSTTSTSSSNSYRCDYGCYTSSNRSYCKCTGNLKGGAYYCSGTNRQQCVASGYRRGRTQSAPCSSGYICKNNACVAAQCTYKGKKYNDNEEWCDGTSRYVCRVGRVSRLSTCYYGCYTSSNKAYCMCPGKVTTGKNYCSGSNVYRCNLSTSYYGSGTRVRSCQYGCSNGFCNQCSPGSRSCSGDYPMECISNGTYYTYKTLSRCPMGCYAGYCHQCRRPGERRCTKSYAELCIWTSRGNQWSQSFCGYGCSNGYCNQCAPNSRRCSGSSQQVCTARSNGYAYQTTSCSRGCYNGYCNQCSPNVRVCVNTSTRRVCQPTTSGYKYVDTKCSSSEYCANGSCIACLCNPGSKKCNGKRIQVCSSNCRQWNNSTLCSSTQYCANGACQACTCTPGAKRCDGKKVETCTNDCRGWTATQTCGSGQYCVGGACKQCACSPGSKRCNGQAVEVCDSSCQKWNKSQTCNAVQFCSNGACQACVCTPGALRCSLNTIQRCKSTCNGWDNYFTCKSGQFCDQGYCKQCTCTPGTKRCNSKGQVETCSPDCRSYSLPTNCPSGQYCVSGSCQVCSCQPGSTRCNGNGVQTCKSDCKGFVNTQTCGSGQYCKNGACQSCVCTPGSKRCSNNSIQTCSNDCMAWQTTTNCPNSQTCANGTCKNCLCTPGARRCDGSSIQVCDSACMKWNKYYTCQSSQYCEKGSCRTCSCKPGTRRCSGNTAQVCSNDCTSWTTSKTCTNGNQCVAGQCRPPGWCPSYNATPSSECNGKVCQHYKCTTWDCTTNNHCSKGQICVNNVCKNQSCNNPSAIGTVDNTCKQKSPDRPYCAVNECRECQYNNTTGIKTTSCSNKSSTKPYCTNYNCTECPYKSFTAFNECQNVNGDFKYCVDNKCGQCPSKWNPRDMTYCGGLPCKDYVCMQCSNSSDTPVFDSNCSLKNPGMPYCKKYKCVECPETNQQSNTCAGKYTNRSFCNASNFCVQCTENGFSAYCQRVFKKDYCSNGTCVECPNYNITSSSVCATKYSNGSKPYCNQYKCVECPNTSNTGTYDNNYCARKYASTSTPKPYCASNTCVQCPYASATKTTACPSNRNICDGYVCKQCLSNSDCPTGTECSNDVCVNSTQQCSKCRTDAWCASNTTSGSRCGAGKNRCRPKDNVCVQCLIDADCPGVDMRCNSSNVCVKTSCPNSCSSDLDCLKADCGSRTRCVSGKCADVTGGTACQAPNLVIILDTSCSMRSGNSRLVNTGVQCKTRTDCATYMKTQSVPYNPRYQSTSQMKCEYDVNAGFNTCRMTRWDVAVSALMKVSKDYGGTPGLNYADRKVRFGLVFFETYAKLAAPIYKDPPELIKLLKERAASGGTRYDRAFDTTRSHLDTSLKNDPIRKRKSGVLFITDGQPNEGCTAGPNRVEQIYNIKDDKGDARKIKTYAVGFGSGLGSSGESCLSKIAAAGRTNSKKCNTGRCLEFYAADSAASLADAFQDIINQTTQEECDGMDNDCDGIIDNNAGGDCSCVKSFTRPASTSSLSPRSNERKAGVKLFTFIAAYDVQGVCPKNINEQEDVKRWREACRNNPTMAVTCTPDKYKQERPASDAYQFYCNRCCNNSGNNTCTWAQSHACRNTPWTGSGAVCVSNCQSWCQQKKKMAQDCLMPRGFLRRSGTGYDSNGKLTVVTVKDFGEDFLNKQSQRWLFVNLPGVDHRTQPREQRPLIADVKPDDYDLPSNGGTTWVTSGLQGWHKNFKFDSSNIALTPKLLGVDKHCGSVTECERDKNELIWTVIGYNPASNQSYRVHRLGPIYHSTPVIAKAPRDVVPDPGFSNWLKTKIPAGRFGDKTVADRPGIVYVGSNDGILHAFNVDTGLELWGVVPATILHKMRSVPNGVDTDGSRLFTVDGTPLVQDIQLTRRVEKGEVKSKWATVLIVGFRAGGRGYIALDVTNPYRPRMLWEINNKSLRNPNNPSGGTFDRLGYTYGQPYLANVLLNWKGVLQERAVAVIPGGVKYSKKLGKNILDQNESTMGAVVYIVDLETGILVRELTNTEARGFASTPVGFGVAPATTTRIFVGDLLGKIFRIDTQSPNPGLWRMEKFYDLFAAKGEVPMPIMSAPAIALNPRGEVVLYGGTGNVENVNFVRGFNKVFSIREKITLSGGILTTVEAIPNYITKLDKYLTNENNPQQTAGPEVTIKSPLGERITGPTVVFNGAAYFTTYTPTTGLPICGVPGYSRVYGLHFNDQCRTKNCFDALVPKDTTHFYHRVLGYVKPSVTPLKCCERDGICTTGRSPADTALPLDATFKSDPTTCGDLHYTVPMLQDKRTAQPYQYHRYLSMGANTLVMGVTFTYQPGEITVAKQGSKLQGHNYSVKNKSSYFLSFQVAGKSTASSEKFPLNGLREVIPSTNTALQSGNYTTVGLAEQVPPLVVASWGAILD